MQQLKWMNAENTVLQVQVGENHYRIIEPGNPDWPKLAGRDDIQPYNPPTSEEIATKQRAEAEANRQAAFQREADPLFFKWQAGEGDEADWLAKREEIRARYPYPE